MQQLEIKFFYPLVEQIPLELDYTNCNTRTLYNINPCVSGYTVSGYTGCNLTTTTITGPITIRQDTKSVGYWELTPGFIVYKNEEPNFVVRLITKHLLGWTWKQK